jgi:predicted RNA-binding protein Jag
VTPKPEEPVVATPEQEPVTPVTPAAPEIRAEKAPEKAADAPAAPKPRKAFGGLGARIKERRKAKLAESKQAEAGETASQPSPADAAPRRDAPRAQAENRSRERRPSRAPVAPSGRDEVILEGIKATKYATPLRDVPESEWDKTLTDLTDGMLARAGFPCQCETHPGEYRQVRIATDDESAGMLIGRHGMTVDAIEHLVERMASNAAGDRVRMNLDINEYRLRREETLVERVAEAAEKIRESGRPVHMEPMSARERRVVHLEAEKFEGLRTFTMFGSGGKHVVIAAEEEGADKAAAASDSSDDFPERDET